MKKAPVSLLCGIGAVIITVILFFTIFQNSVLGAIHFITLVCMVLAEVVTTGYAVVSKGNPRKVAAAVVAGLMIPASVVLSAVYILLFPLGYGAYIGLYFAGMVLVNVIALILWHFDANKSDENSTFQAAKDNMLNLRKLVKCILAEENAQPYQARLKALEENLRFSNDSVIAAEDEAIRQMLLQLYQGLQEPDFEADALLEKIEKTVKTRAIMASRNA